MADTPEVAGARRRELAALALANIVAHLAALAGAGLWLAPASAVVPLRARLTHLARAEHVLTWRAGWGLWLLAAATAVAFVVTAARRLPRSARSQGAMVSVVLAAALDLVGDTLQAVLVPRLAAPEVPVWVFTAGEAAVSGLGTVAANGLYSVAVLLLTSALGRRSGAAVLGTGAATFCCGTVLAGGGLLDHAPTLALAAPLTILAFCAWTVAVAVALARRAPEELPC